MENNRVAIIGEVVSDFEFSHEVFGEGFYMLEVSVNRLSNQPDIIPLMVSERLVDVKVKGVAPASTYSNEAALSLRSRRSGTKFAVSLLAKKV